MSISTSISDERRLVTVLFVDMVGFTHRAEEDDPEQVREIQRSYFETVAAEVERYGGRVEKYIGDAVMAIFGAPQAHGDDAERALHAALAIRQAVAGLDADLQVRIGVNTGEVVGGAGSGPHAEEYTVTGDAVNVAARLQQAAEPGEIYVGASTRRLAADNFELARIAPLELKGKSAPVEAWRLVAAQPERPRVRGIETPLVGRRRELRLLEGALEDAEDGRGLVIGLSGEAGIGKSRLALEMRGRAEASGFGTAWATAPSYASTFPYHLLAQLVEQVVDLRQPDRAKQTLAAAAPEADAQTVERWAALLAEVAGAAGQNDQAVLAEITPSARQRLLIHALGAVLSARAASHPQLLVLDDLHWADASSLSVLDELLQLVAEQPIVVLALFRPGWSNPWASRSYYQQLNLDRLRDADARDLVRALTPHGELDESLAERLLHRSGGNPFFLEELLHASTGDEGAGQRLPETVHELMLARIDALPPDARATLQVAAVAGMEFSEQLLGAVEPVADLPAALAALQRDELVVARPGEPEDRTFVMRHPLVHEVAYRSLLSTRRRTIHRQIGAWLERERGEEAVAEIASHFRDGDDPERAREYLPRAAERAAQLNAQREALDWYRAAADLFADDPGRRAQMLERAATHSYLLGEMDGSISLVSEAQRLYEEAGDRLHALDCRRWLGRYYWFDGRGHEAEREVSAAIEGLEQLPPSPQLALAYSYRSQLRMLMPDFPVGEQLARRAIAVAEQVGSTEALVHALNNLGMCRVGQGDPGGVADVQRSLALALEHNLTDDAARAYTNLSGQGSAINLFDVEEAERRYEEMLAFDRRVAPGGAYEQWHEAGRAELWASVGRWDEAERRLAELTRIHGANRYVQLDIAAFHALLAAYRGRFEEAVTRLRDQDEVAVEIGDMQAYVPLFVALAHAQRGVGEEAAAIAALERVLELRGDRPENNLTAWYLFEAADVCAWLTRHPAPPPAVTDAVARLDAFAASVAVLMAGRGTDPELLVRRALYGASAAHLRHVRGGAGSPASAGEMRRWADDLDAARRIFDAARVRLWAAEQGGDAALARRAAETFEQLRATPYLVRARGLAQPG